MLLIWEIVSLVGVDLADVSLSGSSQNQAAEKSDAEVSAVQSISPKESPPIQGVVAATQLFKTLLMPFVAASKPNELSSLEVPENKSLLQSIKEFKASVDYRNYKEESSISEKAEVENTKPRQELINTGSIFRALRNSNKEVNQDSLSVSSNKETKEETK